MNLFNKILVSNDENQYSSDELKLSDKPEKPNPPDRPKPPGKPEIPPHPVKPPHPEERAITIKVNGTDKLLTKGIKSLSYKDVVTLAYGFYSDAANIIYTVSYSNGPMENPKGYLVKGQYVVIREGMIFNVSRSDKS